MCPSARFFLCARCRRQVLICRGCDRGQLYCGKSCSNDSRRERQREANRRYSKTRAARVKNAQRQHRYREHHRALSTQFPNKVTDQGSAPLPRGDTLVREHVAQSIKRIDVQETIGTQCQACGIQCSTLVRHDFLLPHQRRRSQHRPKASIP